MSLINSRLDHLVVVAADLEQGCRFVENQIGVRPQHGGKHVRMGTHNCLLRLGDDAYLEVIAIDPDAAPPGRMRWFGMDQPEQRARAATNPFLATFVAATDDIQGAVQVLPELGTVEEMQRDRLQWNIAVRDDGTLVDNGAVPVLIQWPVGVHPVRHMPDLGCGLITVEVSHPDPTNVRRIWDRLGIQDRRLGIRAAGNAMPGLCARILTPQGERILA